MIKDIIGGATLGLLVLTSAGCATTSDEQTKKTDPVAIALAQSASEISSAWRDMSVSGERSHGGDYVQDYNGYIPPALRKRVTVRWAGPLDKLTEQLAKKVGWDFREIGIPPVGALLVFIDEEDRSIAEILRNVGYQMGDQGSVIVKPDQLLVEVVYKNE